MDMLVYSKDVNRIKDLIDEDFLSRLADSTVDAYGLSEGEPDILGMRALAGSEAELNDEFLYWVYASAILEDIMEDPEGLSSDHYMFDLIGLNLLLGEDTAITTLPEALAYSRAQEVLAAPEKARLRIDEDEMEQIASKAVVGSADLPDFEAATKAVQRMWAALA